MPFSSLCQLCMCLWFEFDEFNKFGHTGKNDAMIRLNRIIEEHPEFEVRVLAAVYHHSVEYCQGIEEAYESNSKT